MSDKPEVHPIEAAFGGSFLSDKFVQANSAPNTNDPEAFEKFLKERQEERMPYFQVKEVWEREVMEHEHVRKMVNKEMRDRCRVQIDDFMDCVAGAWLGFRCRPHRFRMEKCMMKNLNEDYYARQEELRQQRREDGSSLVDERKLARHNKFVENVPTTPAPEEPKFEPMTEMQKEKGADYSRTEENWHKEFRRVNKAPSEANRMFADIE